jgi:hypothetical protein
LCVGELNPVDLKLDGKNSSSIDHSSSNLILLDEIEEVVCTSQSTPAFEISHFTGASSYNLTLETFIEIINSVNPLRIRNEIALPFLNSLNHGTILQQTVTIDATNFFNFVDKNFLYKLVN